VPLTHVQFVAIVFGKAHHFGAAIKANPSRGGGAKPKGLCGEVAGLPNKLRGLGRPLKRRRWRISKHITVMLIAAASY